MRQKSEFLEQKRIRGRTVFFFFLIESGVPVDETARIATMKTCSIWRDLMGNSEKEPIAVFGPCAKKERESDLRCRIATHNFSECNGNCEHRGLWRGEGGSEKRFGQ
jgi:hypothetical protein